MVIRQLVLLELDAAQEGVDDPLDELAMIALGDLDDGLVQSELGETADLFRQ